MNKIEQLIKQFCPDGVEFKKTGDVCEVLRGKRLTKKELSQNEKYPVYHGGIEVLGYYKQYNRKANTTMIINTGSVGEVVYSFVDFWSSDGTFTIKTPEHINDRFLYFVLKIKESYLKTQKREGGVPTISKATIENIKIPIPPLPIQQEIVSILDKFTQLGAELEAELEERKRQYEYYRDQLLQADEEGMMSSGVKAEWKTLGEVCTVQSGGTPTRSNPQYWNEGSIKWLGSTVCKNTKNVESITDFITEEGLKKSSAKLFKKETTLIALVGATIGKVAFLPFEATTNQNVAGLYPLEINKLNTSYLYYSCKALYEVFTNMSQDKLKMANLTFVRSLKIPIPPLSEQNRIVEILDKFDTLVNDTSIGIPAEIEARRKQYEYYRAKLLDFKECES